MLPAAIRAAPLQTRAAAMCFAAKPRCPQDKTSGYDFFYRQRVIKPALVGLAGPWISGGVEFNW